MLCQGGEDGLPGSPGPGLLLEELPEGEVPRTGVSGAETGVEGLLSLLAIGLLNEEIALVVEKNVVLRTSLCDKASP